MKLWNWEKLWLSIAFSATDYTIPPEGSDFEAETNKFNSESLVIAFLPPFLSE